MIWPWLYSYLCRDNYTSQCDPVNLCKLLVKSMKASDLNISDAAGCTPLHYAARCGASICCMYLMQVSFPLHSPSAMPSPPSPPPPEISIIFWLQIFFSANCGCFPRRPAGTGVALSCWLINLLPTFVWQTLTGQSDETHHSVSCLFFNDSSESCLFG